MTVASGLCQVGPLLRSRTTKEAPTKPLKEIIAIRNEALHEMRRRQVLIAVIDATITTDPRYMDMLESFEGDVESAFPSPHDLGEDRLAYLN